MNLRRVLALLAFTLCCIQLADASHFRYGHLTWKQTGTRRLKITINQAWRLTYSYFKNQCGGRNCAVGARIRTGTITTGGSPSQVDVYLTLTAVNVDENYFIGTFTTGDITYSSNGPHQASFYVCCRIGGIKNNPAELPTSTTIKFLTGRQSNSPASTVPPIVTMQQNRLNKFTMPIADIDLDPVKFTRYAIGNNHGNVENLAVDPNTGEITWNPGSSTRGFYTIVIKMADYDYRYCSPPVTTCSSSRKIGEVMVDFFIEVVEKQAICRDGCSGAGSSCTVGRGGQCGSCSGSDPQCVDNSPPQFIAPTPASQSTLLASQGQSIQFTIKAKDDFSFDTVTIQPSWSINPSPTLTGSLTGTGTASVVFRWSVPSSATEAYQACFYAIDQRQAASGQHCVIIKVGLMAVTSAIRVPDNWPSLPKNEGYSAGGDSLNVVGVNFGGGNGYKCKFRATGSNPSKDVSATFVSSTLVKCTTPNIQGQEGVYAVDVSKDNGQRFTNDGVRFKFHLACPGYPNNMCGGRGPCVNGVCQCAPYSGNACQYLCGNGINEPTEECDDGNTSGGDGCTSTCKVQSGCKCNSATRSVCQCCGNQRREGTETCDDGNLRNGDGCSSACSTEPGWSCTTSIPNVCEKCGNGKLEGAETCDDGNTANSDGCSSQCRVETGYTCTGTPSKCENCGNGRKEHSEACDDGNTNNNDGCSSTCTVETGFTCNGEPSVCHNCGNGKKEGPEECDDGGQSAGDGCSATCTIESGYTCRGNQPTVCQKCGDGRKTGTESCDDGNTANSDGCSSVCTIESGFTCTGSTGQQSVCQKCGNGKKEGTEGCDDGNTANSDGCSATCTIESGFNCDTSVPQKCNKCGNGIVEHLNDKEQCDDGNTANGDGCSSTCTTEGGWTCDTSKKPNVCQKCGNGIIEGTEQCDDNNAVASDGCTNCVKDSGWTCNGQPSVCQKCGNSVLEGTEECDNGDSGVTPDGCDNSCKILDDWVCENNNCVAGTNLCGDKITQVGEECDDGNRVNADGCSSACKIESGFSCSTSTDGQPDVCQKCGNGKREGSETCDDGNKTPGDGCDGSCGIESGWTCSTANPNVCEKCQNGIVEGGEACDDANNANGDGCSSSCTIETGFTCNGQPSVCENCGNGKREGTERCDDNNNDAGDGCSATCTIETGFSCSDGEPNVCQRCGNGKIEGTEECDDNDLNRGTNTLQDGDGCSSVCKTEPGWSCNGQPSLCENCGNGLLELQEQCDDANTVNNDGCTSCVIDSGFTCNSTDPSTCWNCGNGIKEHYEYCDDGNTDPNDGCTDCNIDPGYVCDHFTNDPSVCQNCGNGKREGTENCDDRNQDDGDGCDSTCNVEPGFACEYNPPSRDICENCGDGFLQGNEECDDGNTTATFDGCDSACKIEDGWKCTNSPNVKSVCTEIIPIPLTPGTLYDVFEDLINNVPIDQDYTSSRTTLAVVWSGFTQPDRCSVRLGTSPRGFELMDWVDVGNVTSFVNASMELVDAENYFFSVKCVNAQNKWSFGYADGIRADFTPPLDFFVFDALGFDDTTWTLNKSIVHSSWSVIMDPESTIGSVSWGVGTIPGAVDIAPYRTLWPPQIREYSLAGLDLKHAEPGGLTYYISVTACNTVGGCLTKSSNGFQVDLVPPVSTGRGLVYDGPIRNKDMTYSNGGNNISVNWPAFADFGSGVDHVELAIGKAKGETDVQTWTDIGLATEYTRFADKLSRDSGQDFLNHSETYYTGVRAVDHVGHVSTLWSDGFTVDATPPLLEGVVDGSTPTNDLNETGSEVLQTSWLKLEDPESGISQVEIAVFFRHNGTQQYVYNFSSISTRTFGAVQGARLTNNETYYVIVRATNGALAQTTLTTTGVKFLEALAGKDPASAREAEEKKAREKEERDNIIVATAATAGVIGAGVAGFLGFRSLKKKKLADRKKAMAQARREQMERKSTMAADRSAFNIEPLENDVELEWNNLVENEMRDEVETAGAG